MSTQKISKRDWVPKKYKMRLIILAIIDPDGNQTVLSQALGKRGVVPETKF